MYADGEISKIVLCKPLEDSGRSLGFIPGDVDDKVAPYLKSYKSNIEKIIGTKMTEMMFEKNIITFVPHQES
jgi:phosphate starvation-inducible PhoH-like protein